jgi:hypothetical protein
MLTAAARFDAQMAAERLREVRFAFDYEGS